MEFTQDIIRIRIQPALKGLVEGNFTVETMFVSRKTGLLHISHHFVRAIYSKSCGKMGATRIDKD